MRDDHYPNAHYAWEIDDNHQRAPAWVLVRQDGGQPTRIIAGRVRRGSGSGCWAWSYWAGDSHTRYGQALTQHEAMTAVENARSAPPTPVPDEYTVGQLLYRLETARVYKIQHVFGNVPGGEAARYFLDVHRSYIGPDPGIALSAEGVRDYKWRKTGADACKLVEDADERGV